MKYTQTTFTVPVTNATMTDLEYEIRVGVRCSGCGEKQCKCHPSECRCSTCTAGMCNDPRCLGDGCRPGSRLR